MQEQGRAQRQDFGQTQALGGLPTQALVQGVAGDFGVGVKPLRILLPTSFMPSRPLRAQICPLAMPTIG